MAATAAAPNLPVEIFRPQYVKFLLSPSTPLDFHVNVGDPKLEEMERIGALRWMLIARSKVLRVMLLESQLKPGKEFDIPDIDPETFKHFLTFIYGYDNTGLLPLEDSVKLLGAAEKYDVPDLKDLLAKKITLQVTADNVCTVLQHGPICETVPALWDKATNTVQSYTEIVFGQEQFLALKPEAVVYILQQDALSVNEVDVWRAALKWARHQLSPYNGPPTLQDLRRTIVPLLEHTRLCTLAPFELCKEVIPTKILSTDELVNICYALDCQEQSSNLAELCKKIKKRGKVAILAISDRYNGNAYTTKVIIRSKSTKLKILTATFMANSISHPHVIVPKDLQYECKATVKIHKYNTCESPREIQLKKQIPFGRPAEMPLDVELEANTKYVMEVGFDPCHPCIPYNSHESMNKSNYEIEFSSDMGSSNRRSFGTIQETFFHKWCYKICY